MNAGRLGGDAYVTEDRRGRSGAPARYATVDTPIGELSVGPPSHDRAEETSGPFLPPIGEWARQAACRGGDPGLFYPVRGASNAEAKAVCARCPVIDECLEYALVNKVRFGVWGGTSELQRRRLRRERRRQEAA